MKVFYFGDARIHTQPCARGGHFLYRPTADRSGVIGVHHEDKASPWPARELDSALAGDPALRDPHRPGYWCNEDQPEGVVRLHHRAGWTAISFWDRTGDERHASNSTLLAEGRHDVPTMLEVFAEQFPAIWARITARLMLVEHPGNPKVEAPAPRVRVEAPKVRIDVSVSPDVAEQIMIADVADEEHAVASPHQVATIRTR